MLQSESTNFTLLASEESKTVSDKEQGKKSEISLLDDISFLFSSDSHLKEIVGFRGCTSLCRIEIPSSVETIGIGAFFGSTSLRVIIIRPGCRIRGNTGLHMIKSFLGHEDDDLKECRRLVHPGFGRR
jgi:hypothetical protein